MGLETWELVARLFIAAFLGGVVGLERESHGRPAGFRTHIIVCLGSALIVLVSIYGFLDVKGREGGTGYDVSRVAAQVVSGIGFLGAGTILREGATVRGLTTAATLWTVAGIGMAVGTGMYVGAAIATVFVMLSLMFLGRVERRWLTPDHQSLLVTVADRPGQLAAISSVLARHQIDIRGIDFEELPEQKVQLQFTIKSGYGKDRIRQAVEDIGSLSGVTAVSLSE